MGKLVTEGAPQANPGYIFVLNVSQPTTLLSFLSQKITFLLTIFYETVYSNTRV